MRPSKDSDIIHIPLSFETGNGKRFDESSKAFWAFLIGLVWFISSIAIVLLANGASKWLFPLGTFIICFYIIRFVVFREWYFRKQQKALIENDYFFEHTLFWGIYEIKNRFPYTVYYSNGMKGIFVALEKDVITGKDDDFEFYHHEIIADIYRELPKHNIEFMHMDYMDTLGKDGRMHALFEGVKDVENEDLKNVLTWMYDHVEQGLKNTYTSYDVYCFYSTVHENLFWNELETIISKFVLANYARYRVLDKEEIGRLTATLLNLDTFSVNKANETIFREMSTQMEYLRVIWTEKDGEREVRNRTLEELEELKRASKVEKKVKRKRFGRKDKHAEEIDLFD